jgi:lysozyme family protein
MMRDNFQRSLALVLVHEGGWADHPKDPGGATMKGITLATFRGFYRNNRLTKDQLRAITNAQLQEIYRKRYWDAVKGDDLPLGVDYAVFDFAVNSGPGRAAKFLQKIVGVPQDGQIGPQTLAAVLTPSRPVAIITSLCADRLAWLRKLSTFATFGRGWTTRVRSVETDAQLMVGSRPRPSAPVQSPVQPPSLSPAPEEATRGDDAPTGFWAWLLGLLAKWAGK